MRHSVKLSASMMVLMVLGAQAAGAATFQARDPEFPPRDYTCRFEGQDVALGEQRCLRTPQGARAAQCVIALNMSSWRQSGEACP